MIDRQRVDTRGLSCPQPALMVGCALRNAAGDIEVLADNGTARENIVRLACREGWKVNIREETDDFVRLLLTKE